MRELESVFRDYMETISVEDSAMVKRSNILVLNYFCRISEIDRNDADDMLTQFGYEHEKQGFINGFQYALEMAGAM